MNQEEIMQHLQAGMQALQSGSLESAENIFRNILSADSSEVHSLHFLGVIFCQKGNLEDGIALIEQSIRLDPSRFAPYLNMVDFLLGLINGTVLLLHCSKLSREMQVVLMLGRCWQKPVSSLAMPMVR